MLPESLVRRLIRKKISSKYTIIKEGKPGWQERYDAADDSSEESNITDTITNIIDNDDKDKKPKSNYPMPKALFTEMRKEVDAESDIGKKAKIYETYMEKDNPNYDLPDEDKVKYNDLLKQIELSSDPDSFYKRMYLYAKKRRNENGIAIDLPNFNNQSGAVESVISFFDALSATIIKGNQGEFKGLENARYFNVKGKINDEKAKLGIKDPIQQKPKMFLPLRNSIIADLMEITVTKANLKKILTDSVINPADIIFEGEAVGIDKFYGHITDFKNADNHKRLGHMIDVLFLPDSDEIVSLYNKFFKVDVNDESLVNKDSERIASLWKQNLSWIKPVVKGLTAVYDKTKVNREDITNVYQNWYTAISLDKSDLILTRMIALLVSQGAKTMGDTFFGGEFTADMRDREYQLMNIENPAQIYSVFKKFKDEQENLNDVSWKEICDAHLGTTGQNISGVSNKDEDVYETIGIALWGIWKAGFNKAKALQWFSPKNFPPGDDQGYGKIDRFPNGTGEYYDHISKIVGGFDYFAFLPGRSDAIKSLEAIRVPLGDALYIDEVQVPDEEIPEDNKNKKKKKKEKEAKKESKIFRSKDGSKILVEHKDLRKIIKALKNSRRK